MSANNLRKSTVKPNTNFIKFLTKSNKTFSKKIEFPEFPLYSLKIFNAAGDFKNNVEKESMENSFPVHFFEVDLGIGVDNNSNATAKEVGVFFVGNACDIFQFVDIRLKNQQYKLCYEIRLHNKMGQPKPSTDSIEKSYMFGVIRDTFFTSDTQFFSCQFIASAIRVTTRTKQDSVNGKSGSSEFMMGVPIFELPSASNA